MTYEQKFALYMLLVALKKATDTSLFDELAREIHPDVINEFCDGVSRYVRVYFPAETNTEDKGEEDK